MSAPTLEPFTDHHVAAAGALLADRHRRQRAVEPLLPERFEEPAHAVAQVAEAWARDGTAGAVAIRGGELVGYLVGSPKSDQVWGANQWIENAGHAVTEPEIVRDLYAYVAERWVEAGRTRHYAVVPATDPALVDAWSRLSFGQQQAYGIREVPAEPWPAGVREARADDLEGLIGLAPLVEVQHRGAPTFAVTPDTDMEELREEVVQEIAAPETGSLVAERGGRIVGSVIVAPITESSMHTGLARPEGQCILGWQATLPEVRGTGAGVALVDAAFAWAHDRGYTTIVSDWRVANLLASRFWPRRGFRTSFLRMYRSIP